MRLDIDAISLTTYVFICIYMQDTHKSTEHDAHLQELKAYQQRLAIKQRWKSIKT